MVANYEVGCVLVNSGSSVNIIFQEALNQMELVECKLEPMDTSLFGFAGHSVVPKGDIILSISMGDGELRKKRMMPFIVVDSPFSFMAVASTCHPKIKFPVGAKVGEVRGDQSSSRKCYVETMRVGKKKTKLEVKDRGSGELSMIKEGEQVQIEVVLGQAEKVVKIAKGLEGVGRKLIECLRRYSDVFAWSSDELKGISPLVAEHKLNITPGARPVKQKKRHFGPEKDKVIEEQVRTMMKASHIREVQFPTWLSNVVLVPKATGKWRMCVDFRDLNKSCPKDCYPLPRIDQLVDSTSEFEFLYFMDAYQGYHQIPLALEDQDKISFVTSGGTLCYVVIPFGLKNAGATYQWLMDQIFKEQVGRNVEVYVDGILVKSKSKDDLILDLEETFSTLKRYEMRLNPAKCTFGVKSGKFLGYMVTERGIEVNGEKVKAILDMTSPKSTREVQRLAGRIAALSRFISRSAHRSYPFFQVLRRAQKCEWDEKCEAAFNELKQHLASLPVLVKPEPGERLWVYLSATEHVVSSALIRMEGVDHKPIYYVSHALKGPEARYTEVEKISLALVITARKLRPYFLSRPITMLTNSPLERILTQPDISGRLVKWTVELGEYDIEYQPRTTIKAQALTDFLAETMQNGCEEVWNIYVDGAANKEGSGVGAVIISPSGEKMKLAVKLDFRASNNEAEYEAVLIGLRAARDVGAVRVVIYSHSQLAAQQVKGSYEAKNEKLVKYLKAIQDISEHFVEWSIVQIAREDSGEADSLAKMATSLATFSNKEVIHQVELSPSYELSTQNPETDS